MQGYWSLLRFRCCTVRECVWLVVKLHASFIFALLQHFIIIVTDIACFQTPYKTMPDGLLQLQLLLIITVKRFPAHVEVGNTYTMCRTSLVFAAALTVV